MKAAASFKNHRWVLFYGLLSPIKPVIGDIGQCIHTVNRQPPLTKYRYIYQIYLPVPVEVAVCRYHKGYSNTVIRRPGGFIAGISAVIVIKINNNRTASAHCLPAYINLVKLVPRSGNCNRAGKLRCLGKLRGLFAEAQHIIRITWVEAAPYAPVKVRVAPEVCEHIVCPVGHSPLTVVFIVGTFSVPLSPAV